MALPVYLQQFKSAGVYRVVFDKSTILNQDTEILRLVVGYSEQGPFNIPVYVKDPQTFRTLFGGISKKLEKRGIFFHRLALQCLNNTPIIALNLKKFSGETVQGSTISTDFNPSYEPIDTVSLDVEDIYDTTRFWTLSPDKLNNLRASDGTILDQYINIAAYDAKKMSNTYFIRKASGSKVSEYNITVSDWYSNEDSIPEYLEDYKNSLISDFFAEVYVFKGKFDAKQVMASDVLKEYFITKKNSDGTTVTDNDGNPVLQLRQYVLDGYGDKADTLDRLYEEETANPIGHYVGALIPYFTNKMGSYVSLDILFNSEEDVHNMMMSFNIDMLEEESVANIDLSGKLNIPIADTSTTSGGKKISGVGTNLSLNTIFKGTASTTLLGNTSAPVIADIIKMGNNIGDYYVNTQDDNTTEILFKANIPFKKSNTRITGSLYVSSVTNDVVTLKQVDSNETVTIYTVGSEPTDDNNGVVAAGTLESILTELGVNYEADTDGTFKKVLTGGTYFNGTPFNDYNDPLNGPEKIITSIARLEQPKSQDYMTDVDANMKASFLMVNPTTTSYQTNNDDDSVYGSSISFIDYNDDNWEWREDVTINGASCNAFVTVKDKSHDTSLINILQAGDTLLAADGENDNNHDDEYDDNDKDNYYDNVYVQETGIADISCTDSNGKDIIYEANYIILSGAPLRWNPNSNTDSETSHKSANAPSNDGTATGLSSVSGCVLVRVDKSLNQEIGTMIPQYLQGYTYKNDKPNGTGMYAKLQWQQFILSALTDYKGLRTGLLNKSEIDYRYIVDTFESFPQSSLKSELSYLAKEKQSCFVFANFPAVKTFVKCPYTSFVDANGIFDVNYVVEGYNKKKPSTIKFSIPSDGDGASYMAFYTPLKFADGYVDNIIPSAALVSNLFINKYYNRQPYYIVAGPNYGLMQATGLVGPDYMYSRDELNIIEPYGVNCMVYRPTFGTFINANQTAKQTPVSALSKVNVRELVIYLQDEIEKVLQAYQWEFNNATTRNAILDKANYICSIVQSNGGIQAYENIMDESNNTNEVIDNEFAILSTSIEPGMGCGKMVHELTIYRSGQLTSSTTES